MRSSGIRGAAAIVLSVFLAGCGAAVAPTTPSGSNSPTSSAPVATATTRPSPVGPPATADDWPFFRGDAARTGEGGSGPKGKPVQVWRYQAKGSINGAVLIVGDFVYVTSDDDVLQALDINTSEQKWHFSPVNAPVSAPAYADGIVYAFDGAGTLFALNASSGDVRWHAAKPLLSPSGPTIADGVLYVGTGDGALVALDAGTGAELWRYAVAPTGGVHNPAVADGNVYAASDSGGMVAVDIATHQLAWRWDTGTDITGSVVVADGIAYVGGTGDSQTGNMSAIDVKTGKLKWQLDRPFTAPAVADGIAFEGDQIGGLQARDTATGAELWGLATQRAGPSVAQGVVYVPVSDAHRIDAFDARTGARLWQFPVDGGNDCCVAVAHGAVFAATTSGSVYKIGGDGSAIQPGPTPPPPASATPSPSNGPTATPSATPSPVAQFLWSSRGGDAPMAGPGAMSIDPQGRLWIADTGHSQFAILKPDGTFVEYWEHKGSGPGEFNLQRPTSGDGYGAIAYAPDGTFYVLDVGNFRVEHFDARRQLINEWGGYGDAPGQFVEPTSIVVGATGVVSVLDDVRDVVEHYDHDGKVLGSFTSSDAGGANALATDSAGNFYISDARGGHHEVEKFGPSGKLLLTIGPDGAGTSQFADQPGQMAIDSRGRIFVAVGKVIDVFDAAGAPIANFMSPNLQQGGGFFSGLVLDGVGHGYVAELGTDQVEKFELLAPFAP